MCLRVDFEETDKMLKNPPKWGWKFFTRRTFDADGERYPEPLPSAPFCKYIWDFDEIAEAEGEDPRRWPEADNGQARHRGGKIEWGGKVDVGAFHFFLTEKRALGAAERNEVVCRVEIHDFIAVGHSNDACCRKMTVHRKDWEAGTFVVERNEYDSITRKNTPEAETTT